MNRMMDPPKLKMRPARTDLAVYWALFGQFLWGGGAEYRTWTYEENDFLRKSCAHETVSYRFKKEHPPEIQTYQKLLASVFSLK